MAISVACALQWRETQCKADVGRRDRQCTWNVLKRQQQGTATDQTGPDRAHVNKHYPAIRRLHPPMSANWAFVDHSNALQLVVVYLSDERLEYESRRKLGRRVRCCCSDSRNAISLLLLLAAAVARPRLRTGSNGEEWLFSWRRLFAGGGAS